jgi:hypothetical protein
VDVDEFLFPADSRGNKLRRHLLLQDPQAPVDYLCVKGCGDVVAQVVTYMAGVGGRDIDPASIGTPDGSRWPDVFCYPREHRAEVQALVAVLTDNLTLVKVPELDAAMGRSTSTSGAATRASSTPRPASWCTGPSTSGTLP